MISGQRVSHERYGLGNVVARNGVISAIVNFDKIGEKTVPQAHLKSTNGAAPLSRPPVAAPAPRLSPLRIITADEFSGLEVPPREFHVPVFIPARVVTLLYGDGGTGKSLLALMLAASTALGHPWLGRQVRSGPAIYLTAEDDEHECHRRLADIAQQYDCDLCMFSDLHIIPLAGEDAVLAVPENRSNIIKATPLWGQIVVAVARIKPVLVVLDTLADLFAGDENNRSQAKQFIRLLQGVALHSDTTIVVLAHPSMEGIRSGNGSSGSTGWSNSVRSRLFFKRMMLPDGKTEVDSDVRKLELMKANYSRIGESFDCKWVNGAFVLDKTNVRAGSLGALSAMMETDEIFIDLLARYHVEGRSVGAAPGANYAPAIFSRDQRARGATRAGLTISMNRLFGAGRIEVIEFGPPSKRTKQLRLVETGRDE